MGFFDFMSDKGKSLLGSENDAEAIKAEIESSFDEPPVDGLVVDVYGENVTLAGVAKDFDTREKVILIVGNIKGVGHVNADQLITTEMLRDSSEDEEESSTEQNIEIPEEIFYTIADGDTLWDIATKFYNDGSKYKHIVDANLEVIKDENLIYPGQTIRIPEVSA